MAGDVVFYCMWGLLCGCNGSGHYVPRYWRCRKNAASMLLLSRIQSYIEMILSVVIGGDVFLKKPKQRVFFVLVSLTVFVMSSVIGGDLVKNVRRDYREFHDESCMSSVIGGESWSPFGDFCSYFSLFFH